MLFSAVTASHFGSLAITHQQLDRGASVGVQHTCMQDVIEDVICFRFSVVPVIDFKNSERSTSRSQLTGLLNQCSPVKEWTTARSYGLVWSLDDCYVHVSGFLTKPRHLDIYSY